MRCFNPPRLDEPLGWIARDHRKSIVVDGRDRLRDRALRRQALGGLAGARPGRAGATPAWRSAARRWRTWRGRSRRPGPPAATRCRRRSGRRRPRRREGDIALRVVATDLRHRRPLSPRPAGGRPRPQHAVAHRRLLRGHSDLRAGPGRRGPGRRGRAPARARARQRHRDHAGHLPRRLPPAARGGRARVRVERADAARQDGGRRRALVARRLHQPEPRELDGQLGAGRGGGGRGVRPRHGGDVHRGPRQRDGDRARAAAEGPADRRQAHAAPARRRRQRHPRRRRRAAHRQRHRVRHRGPSRHRPRRAAALRAGRGPSWAWWPSSPSSGRRARLAGRALVSLWLSVALLLRATRRPA